MLFHLNARSKRTNSKNTERKGKEKHVCLLLAYYCDSSVANEHLSAFYQWDCSRHTTSLVSCLSLPDHSALAILLITAKISFDLATSWVLTFTPCETVHSLSLFGGAVSAIQGLNLKAAMLSPSGSPLVSVGQPVNMSFALWLHSLPETFLLACTYVMSRSPSALLIIAAYFLIIF